MISEWKEFRLGDITEWASGGTPSKQNVDFWNGTIPWISASSMVSNRYSESDLKITQEGLKAGSRIAKKGSILLLVRGSTLHQRIPVGIATSDVSFNQDVKAIKAKEEFIDPWYLLFWFMAKEKDLLNMVENTGIGAGKLDTNRLQNLLVKIPPDAEKDKILLFAKAFDDKLFLNRQINQTLESMAQAIFKSWFVDFEPVKAKIAAIDAGEDAEGIIRAAMSAISGKTDEELDQLQAEQPEYYTKLKTTASVFPSAIQDSELGNIPKGLEIVPFSILAKLDTTSVKPYKEPDKLWEHYSIPAFDTYEAPILELGSEIKSNKYKVNPSAILSSKLNPNIPRTWWPDVEYETSAICSTEFMQFIPTDEAQRAFIFGLITSEPFQSGINQRVTGSTGSRQRAQPGAVADIDVVKPKDELVLAYCSHLTALFVLKAKHIKENITLTKLRDNLLPKLLSGELSVEAAEFAEK